MSKDIDIAKIDEILNSQSTSSKVEDDKITQDTEDNGIDISKIEAIFNANKVEDDATAEQKERLETSFALGNLNRSFMGKQMAEIRRSIPDITEQEAYDYLTTDAEDGSTDAIRGTALADRIKSGYAITKGDAEDREFIQTKYTLADELVATLPLADPINSTDVMVGANRLPRGQAERVMAQVVENTMHPDLLKSNEAYRNNFFMENYGTTAEKYLIDLDKKLAKLQASLDKEIKRDMDAMPSLMRGGVAGGVDPRAVQSFVESESYGGNTIRNAREKIQSILNNNFASGVDEGFDALSALSLGINDIMAGVSINNILSKSAAGKPLTKRESVALEAYDISEELEGLQDIIVPQSWVNKVGQGLGTTAEMAMPFIPTMSIAGSVGKLATLPIRASAKLTRRAFNKGVVNGVTTGMKRAASLAGKSLHNVGVSTLSGLVVAPLMPSTWSTFVDNRNKRFEIKDGKVVAHDRSVWKDLANAWIESAGEIGSERIGIRMDELIKGSASSLGRALAIDNLSSKVGKILFGGKTPAYIKSLQQKAGFTGYLSEPLSEVWGDAVVNLMKMGLTGDDNFAEMGNADYWTTTLATCALYGTGLKMATEGLPMTKRIADIERIGRYRKNALNGIESESLYNTMVSILAEEDIEAAAKRLSEIEWNKYHRIDIGHAMDAIRAHYAQSVALSSETETARLNSFMGQVGDIANITYRGKEGNENTNEVVTITDKNGVKYMAISGDSTTPFYVCLDANLERINILSSDVVDVSRTTLEERMATAYSEQFSTEIEMERQQQLIDRYNEVRAGVGGADAINRVRTLFGAEEHRSGDDVTLADGTQAIVEEYLPETGEYVVTKVDGTMECVPFYNILSTNAFTAEAQSLSFAQRALSTAENEIDVEEDVENSTETEQITESDTAEDGALSVGDVVITPTGERVRIRAINEDGSYEVDYNTAERVSPEDMEIEVFAGADLKAESEGVAPAQDILTDVDTPPISEGVEETVAEETSSVASQIENKPIPTNEDGTINYEAIEDPKQFVDLYSHEAGGIDTAITDVKEMRDSAVAEVAKNAEQGKKITSPNEKIGNRKKQEALAQKVAFYDSVLAELEQRVKPTEDAENATPVEDVVSGTEDVVGAETAEDITEDATTSETKIEEAQPKEVGLVDNELSKDLRKSIYNTLNALGEALGIQIELVDAIDGVKANGQIIGNRIQIAWKDRMKAVTFVAGHEFLHRLKDIAPEQYEKFKESVKNDLGEDGFAARINRMRRNYEYTNEQRIKKGQEPLAYTDTLLEEEVIADRMGEYVENTDAFNHYLESIKPQNALLRAIRDAWAYIKNLFKGAEYRAETKRINDMLEAIDALIDAGASAIKKAQNTERVGESNAVQDKERHSIIGEVGASALDMAEEATTRLDNLNIARQMEERGDSALDIRMATGWERGADGLWRYEIMDAEVNLYDGDENTIRKKIEVAEEEEKDFMQQSKADTKELRERTNAYLAQMREKYGVAEGEETDAMTEEEIAQLQSLTNKEIEFEDYKERRRNELYNRRMALEAQLGYVRVKNTDDSAMILSTRLGHILQGNDAEVLFAAHPSLRDIEVQFVTDIRDGAFAAYATKGGYKRIELNAKKTPVDMLAPYILHEVQHAIQDIEGFAGGGNLSSLQSDENVTAKEAYDYYRKIAGEVEARNVSARINMTPEERRATLLSETEDVAREDQIFLREGAEMAMAGKKKSADETVSPNNSDHSTAISSADGAKVLKKLDNLAKKYQEKPNRPHTFIGDVAEALGINMPNKSSKYGTYETMSGDMVTIRLSNHNATASNLDAMGEDEAISIVVTNKPNNWLVNDGESHIIEFYYNSIALGKADGKPLVDIINSLKQTLYSGKYVDKTGLAQVQEINPRYSLVTPEMDASYLDAVERGDMATAQKMVMEAAKLAMPNTKVVDEDGNPKVVYHGTPNNFNAFSKEMFGSSTDRGIWGNGFYFSDSEQYAKTYEKRGDKQGKTLSVFLNIKRPLFISLRNGGNEGAMYFHELMEKHFTDDIYEDVTRTDELMSVAQERLTADIVANGYDGIVVEYTNHIDTEYIAFEPNQIKSADTVTYDDAGNVIPLSERFNPEKEDIRYSVQTPSLLGVHNISLDKLRKVIKMGGLANPSVAVIDVDKQTHDDYGEYSLILPNNMVDARKGKNAGTWAGDAWTPTYPSIIKRMTDDKAISRFYKDIDNLPEAMRSRVKLDFDSFMEGRSANALAYWYLFEKGNAPEMVLVPSRYSDDVTNAVSEATNNSFSMYGLTPEERAKCLDVYIAVKFNGDRAAFEEEMQARIDRLTETIETKKSDRVKKWAQDTIDLIKEYGFDYDDVAKFIRDVEYDAREKGTVNVDATITAAREQVEANNLEADYDAWRNNLDERYGIKEYIFDGYTNSGDRRYLPHTVENASKWMKKQGRQGAVATFPSFGTFVAVSIPKMTTLESIRKRKALLGKSKEEYDAFREKWENVYYELGKKLQPDAKSFDDYGYWRLIEVVGHKNPKEFVKKEYNIELSEEDMAQLNDMLNAIRTEYPARYFETKFERPLQLSDFVAAVVPNDIPLDVESRLKDANVEIFEYEKGNSNSRAEAMQKASEVENVRFSLQDAETQRFIRKVEFVKGLVRNYNIPNPLFIAETKEEFVQMVRDYDGEVDEYTEDTYGYYSPDDDIILLNGGMLITSGDAHRSTMHEYAHSITKKYLGERLAKVTASILETEIDKARKEMLPEAYNEYSYPEIIDEFTSLLLEDLTIAETRAIFEGEMAIDTFVEKLKKDINAIEKLSNKDILYAVIPLVVENLKIQKEQYGKDREHTIVIPRVDSRKNSTLSQASHLSGDKKNRPSKAESRVYETGRGGESTQEKEVTPRHSIHSADSYATGARITEETIRTYMKRGHQVTKVNIRKKYKAYRDVAKSDYAEKRRVRLDKIKTLLTNSAKVDYIFGDIDEYSTPYLHQAFAKIARGEVRIIWDNSPDGKKRGIASETGAKKGEKRLYASITNGATLYFEEYVHQWWQELNGYENDIDTQELRNALIEALSEVCNANGAISKLREIYDNDQKTLDEALDVYDREEDRELADETARYEQEVADFEQNKDAKISEFESSLSFFDELAVIDGTISEMRSKLEKILEKSRSRVATEKMNTREIREAIAEIKRLIKNAIDRQTIASMQRNELRSMLDKIDKARSINQVSAIAVEIENTILEAKIRFKRRELDKLLRLRIPDGTSVSQWVDTQVKEGLMSIADSRALLEDMWRGRNSSGVSVAKFVDPATAKTMEELRKLVMQTLKTKIVEDVDAKERGKVSRRDEELSLDVEAAIESNNGRLDELANKRATQEREGIDKTPTSQQYTDADAHEYAARSIYDTYLRTIALKQDIADIAKWMDDVRIDYYGMTDKVAVRDYKLEKLREEMVEARRKYAEALENLNSEIMQIMREGKNALSAFRMEQDAHKSSIVKLGLDALRVNTKLLPDKGNVWERTQAFLRGTTNASYNTFQTTLKEIDRFAPNGEGRFYNYFMGLWQECENKLFTQHSDNCSAVASMLRTTLGLKGKNDADIISAVIEQADAKFLGTITYSKGVDRTGDLIEPEEKPVTVSTAMFIIAMWRQTMYRNSLIKHGIDQQMIDTLYDLVNKENEGYIVFMNWVNESLLPNTRLVYDKVHREMFGASMAEERNYFPARVVNFQETVDVGNDNEGALPSTITGAIINRKKNALMPDITQNYFKVLMGHLQEMDQWSAFAPLIRDLNTLLSNTEFKNACRQYKGGVKADRKGLGDLYSIFRNVSAIAVDAYKPKRNDIEDAILKAMRGWAGSNIAWRLLTAIKQLSSMPVFALYALDGKMQKEFVKSIAYCLSHPKAVSKWAMANSPQFRKRWESKFAGLDILNTTIGAEDGIADLNSWSKTKWGRGSKTLDKGIHKVASEMGMSPNAFVDAISVVVGLRAIYNYELNKLMKRDGNTIPNDKQKYEAMRKAEIVFNTTQQSGESAYLSTVQLDRSLVLRGLTIYQNSPFAFHRLMVSGVSEIAKQMTNAEYRNAIREEYGDKALSDARKKAYAQLMQSAAGSYLFALMGQAIANGFYSLVGGDDDEYRSYKNVLLGATATFLFGGVVGGAVIISGLQGYGFSLTAAWDDAVKSIEKLLNVDYWLSGEAVYEAINIVARYKYGVDLDTFTNIATGIQGYFEGSGNVEATMKILNAPRSQVNLVAGVRRDDETIMEYVTRRMRVQSLLSVPDYNTLFSEDGEFIGKGVLRNSPFRVSEYQAKKYHKQYAESYNSNVVTRFGGASQLSTMKEIDSKYAERAKAIEITPNSIPSSKTIHKVLSTNGNEEDLIRLLEAQMEVGIVHKEMERFVGTDENYYKKAVELNKAKENFISIYDELNK